MKFSCDAAATAVAVAAAAFLDVLLDDCDGCLGCGASVASCCCCCLLFIFGIGFFSLLDDTGTDVNEDLSVRLVVDGIAAINDGAAGLSAIRR